MNNILILYDNRGYVASSLKEKGSETIDIKLLQKKFIEKGYNVHIACLHDLIFPTTYAGWYVIYPSSEDPGLFYKNFIEDILLRLQMDGAILLPCFEYFRAHHNKVFMEFCRTELSEEYNTLSTYAFYSIDDLKRFLKKTSLSYPIVIKSSAGAGSLGVKLARTEKELLARATKMGNIHFSGICYTNKIKLRQWLGLQRRKLLKVKIPPKTYPREKLILQPFVSNLTHDYKVLVFGEKYYILKRNVRSGDFRASGSGKLEFPLPITEIEKEVLEFARGAFEQLKTPLLSIDIAYDGKKCHLIEFQCVNFGPYTIQFSSCYYVKKTNWEEIQTKSILEEEMANAISLFIQKGN